MKRLIRVSLLLVCLLLTSVVALALFGVDGQVAAQTTDLNHRYVIFLHGLRPPIKLGDNGIEFPDVNEPHSAEAAAKSDFNYIAMDIGLGDSHYRYFSYSGKAYESISDTLSSVTTHAAAINGFFAEILSKDPSATFDLIGHSEGGVVAAYWVSRQASASYLARIHSVIGIDSPFNGWDRLIISGLCTDAGHQVKHRQNICQDLDKNSDIIKKDIPHATEVANIFYLANDYETDSPDRILSTIKGIFAKEVKLNGAIDIFPNYNKAGPTSRDPKSDAHGAALHDSDTTPVIANVVKNNYYRPKLTSLPVTLEGSGWGNWQADWLFGKSSYETSKIGDSANLMVSNQFRYLTWYTQQDQGRGPVRVYVDNHNWGLVNLRSNNYKDVRICYDLGQSGAGHFFKIQLQGKGNLNVNAFQTSQQSPDPATCLNNQIITAPASVASNQPQAQPRPAAPAQPVAQPAVLTVNDESGDFHRFGPEQYWQRDSSGDNGGSTRTTGTSSWVGVGANNYAEWSPTLPKTGKYELKAHIPSYATAINVVYEVYDCNNQRNNIRVNQAANRGNWISLGEFCLPGGKAVPEKHVGGKVILSDVNEGVPNNSQVVGWDTLQFIAR